MSNLAPSYLSDLVTRYIPRCNLHVRSANSHRLLDVRYNLRNYGFRSLSVVQLWNEMPIEIRSCDGLIDFKKKLKIYLFRKEFH